MKQRWRREVSAGEKGRRGEGRGEREVFAGDSKPRLGSGGGESGVPLLQIFSLASLCFSLQFVPDSFSAASAWRKPILWRGEEDVKARAFPETALQ